MISRRRLNGGSGDQEKQRSFTQLARVATVGTQMAACVLVGWGAGYWLDGKFGTKPWLMLLFLLLGVVAGFKGLIETAQQISRSYDSSDSSSNKQDSQDSQDSNKQDSQDSNKGN